MATAEPTKVLAIDDDPDICFYIQEILERNNCVVTLTERGREALRLIATGTFDIVMADVRLPDLDGVSILEHVRASGSEIPFVLITGFSEHEPIISSIRLGAVDYLTKPFTPSDLEKSLRRALHQKKRLDWSRHLYQIAEHQDFTLHEKIQKILLLSADILGMDCGFVVRSSSDGQMLSFSSGQSGPELDAIALAYKNHVQDKILQIQQRNQPSFAEEATGSWAAIPLRMNQEIQGALCFFQAGPRKITAQDTARSVLQLTELSISRLLEAEESAVIIANQQNLIMNSQNLSNLGAIATSLVHEIENHLNTITDHTVMVEKILQSDAATHSAKIKGAMDSIGSDVKRMDRIVKSVRTMTLARQPNDAFQELLEVQAVLEEALELFRCTSHARPIRLTVGEIPSRFFMRGDSNQLLQVFLILLNNSFDAIEGMAEEWIQVDCGIVDHALQIAITDSGRGIPPHLHEHIFVPFFTTKNNGKGLGVGLSLARKYTEAHHGKLWIDPQSSNTRFVVQFSKLLDDQGKALNV